MQIPSQHPVPEKMPGPSIECSTICEESHSVACRFALRCVVECCNSLAKYMEEQGPTKAMDVDELLLRESMDVIGQPGIQNLCSWEQMLTDS